MKIIGSGQQSIQNPLYQKPSPQRPAQSVSPGQPAEKSAAPASPRRAAAPAAQKITLPKNYQPGLGLSKKEQQFFEDIFPKARREIRAYAEQQQKNFAVKGQIIDRKG